MAIFEYKTVPAPKKARKVRGVKGREAQFAATVSDLLNSEAVDGWEFYRAETLTTQERTGMFRRVVEVEQTVLIFRRSRGGREGLTVVSETSLRQPRPEDIGGAEARIGPAR